MAARIWKAAHRIEIGRHFAMGATQGAGVETKAWEKMGDLMEERTNHCCALEILIGLPKVVEGRTDANVAGFLVDVETGGMMAFLLDVESGEVEVTLSFWVTGRRHSLHVTRKVLEIEVDPRMMRALRCYHKSRYGSRLERSEYQKMNCSRDFDSTSVQGQVLDSKTFQHAREGQHEGQHEVILDKELVVESPRVLQSNAGNLKTIVRWKLLPSNCNKSH